MTRPSSLFLLTIVACTQGRRVANAPQDSVQVTGPAAVSAQPADSLRSGGPLDSIPALLAAADSQAEAARSQARPVAATPRADSLFLTFRNGYLRVAERITDKLDQASGVQLSVLNDTATSGPLAALLAKHGFAFEYSEGNAYADEDVGYWARFFNDVLTPAMRRYLEIRATEQGSRFSEDAGLRISWDELGDRIATWEQFADSHPDFTWRNASQFWYETYLSTYLTGMDNSRVFTDSGVLKPAVRRSYELFLTRHPRGRATSIVAQYLALLKQNGFRQTPSVDAFLTERHVASMLGVQPPIR